MNTLSSNPKKTMFYAAAQNMLNSNQSSMQNLKRSLFQLALFPSSHQKDQLNLSLNNNSDRAQANYSLPRKSNIFQNDRDRSLSYKQNISMEQNGSVERLQNAYNIKGHFQLMNEDPNQIVEKEQKKLELKEYLLKQIEEKKNQQKYEQERKRIEDAKAEQLVKKQLEEMRARQHSKFENSNIQQSQGSIWLIYYYIRKTQHNQYKQRQYNNNLCHLRKKAYSFSQQTDILQKINHLQNDIKSLQITQQQQNDVNSVRNNIKLMMKKQSSMNPEQINKIQKKDVQQLKDRQLDCETIFIPANLKLNTDVDILQQNENTVQDVNKSTNSLNFTKSSQNQLILNNTSVISNQLNNISLQQVNNQIVNHSRLTISQISSRNRSLSYEKQVLPEAIQIDNTQEETKLVQKQKKPKQNNLQLKLPHRTTMLMQIPSKNQIQTQKSEEPKSSQRN
ncbi:unnamed protein product (macronuclear) [Paramecium tetraurelia]|uniref:Uncharacterized protein n=1 Tax=Paramecium tetraurelia TaxID=5888 RepID=A0CB04_PARTE|nr:uncharacterized protein GSPATT00036754001 [Paramecium tetraurelia]CAK67971.1 unnamed protein product [Paramecium tetraurelia]|eukprot:XP_001435368.1 hypothetical protein (macronuclear) [Paramecium tetraurelia strain d4-2]